jgi:hypothetical protein
MRNRGPQAGLLLATSVIALAGSAKAGETITYSYDSLGRLIRVSRSGEVNSGVNADYSYDSADNRSNVTVVVPAAGSPLVVGGGFETPEMGSGALYRPTGSPVSFTGNSGVAGNGSAWGFAAAPEGDQVGFLANDPAAAGIALPVIGLTLGASYRISFRITARPGFLGVPVTLAFNGAAIGTFNPGTYAFVAATSAPFTAAASSGTLSFTGIATTDFMASAVDMVTIAPSGGQP